MLEGVRLVIYDLDGVLIDATDAILSSFRLVLGEVGAEYREGEIMRLIGHGIIHILEEILPTEHHGRVWELRERFIHHFQNTDPSLIQVLPGVEETLRAVRQRGVMQSVATNKTSSEARRILGHLGLLDGLDLVVGFMDVPNAKPAPDMILYTLEKLGVESERAAFVDDTTFGLAAGVDAGVKTVAITTGYQTREQLATVNPDYIVDSISEITRLLG